MAIGSLTVEALKVWLEQENVLLIDVREIQEYQQGSISEAYWIPLSLISTQTLPSLEKKIAIYCRSGKRSHIACEKLLAETPQLQLYNVEGGILAWVNAGYSLI